MLKKGMRPQAPAYVKTPEGAGMLGGLSIPVGHELGMKQTLQKESSRKVTVITPACRACCL